MSKQSRVGLMQMAADLYGEDLEKKLTEVVVQSRISKAVTTFDNDNEFLDDADLSEKYKNKPDMLSNIKQNGFTITCPVKKMYAVCRP